VWKKLRAAVGAMRHEVAVWRLVLADPRTPRPAKVLLAAAIGYALSPIDLIPDWIPVLGHLDDLVVVPGLVWLATRLVPRHVVAECRQRAKALEEKPPAAATPAEGGQDRGEKP